MIKISQNSLPWRLLLLSPITILLDIHRSILQSLLTPRFLSKSSDLLKKLAIYFHCATGLCRTIVRCHNTRKQFSHIDVVAIDPPEPEFRVLQTYWYHVLECIWYRNIGGFLPITRGQFISRHAMGLEKYVEWGEQKVYCPCRDHADYLIGRKVS